MARGSRSERRIAIHEAGHVVAAWWVGGCTSSATIESSDDYIGCMEPVLYEDFFELGKQFYEDRFAQVRRLGLIDIDFDEYWRTICIGARRDMVMLMSGTIAEHRHIRKLFIRDFCCGGGRDDYLRMCDIAKNLPEPDEICWPSAIQTARFLVRDHWEIIKKVADALLEHRTLEFDQIEELFPYERGHMCKLEFTAAWDINMGDGEMEAA